MRTSSGKLEPCSFRTSASALHSLAGLNAEAARDAARMGLSSQMRRQYPSERMRLNYEPVFRFPLRRLEQRASRECGVVLAFWEASMRSRSRIRDLAKRAMIARIQHRAWIRMRADLYCCKDESQLQIMMQ